ncbi:Uncharacterized protein dnm_016880 [Desulfonema magnum]|uniref:Uncharacterized protein n=1 Tax=Desulfonema magnum TaxID=45655 RepID=A0A975BIB1_9BACT|nr:Uncharacterized protein dnm_016880 [Desulfonema magnum]
MCEKRNRPFFCHEDTQAQSFTKFLCVFVADFFGCVKSGTGHFFATKTRRHKVSRSFSVSLRLIFSDV